MIVAASDSAGIFDLIRRFFVSRTADFVVSDGQRMMNAFGGFQLGGQQILLRHCRGHRNAAEMRSQQVDV